MPLDVLGSPKWRMNRRRHRILVSNDPLTLLIALATVAVVATGCDDQPPTARDVAAFAAPLILPGATDVRNERDSPDVGISVFSYITPPEIGKGGVTAALRDQLKRQHPCYEVLSGSGESMQWRCADGARQLHGTAEIRAIVDGASERTFVLMLRSIPVDPQIYKEFVSTLDETVQRSRGRRQ
jgi:hypothetical protein